jgi:uncharacterized protein
MILTSKFYPGIFRSVMETATCTAFVGTQKFASGTVPQVALRLYQATQGLQFLVFSDQTGKVIDIDLRGSAVDVVTRLEPVPVAAEELPTDTRGRGRPRLGVVAREVTLLPRHWDWLATQPGGASVALRKLVEAARRSNGDHDRVRAAQAAAYHFLSAMAGNLPGFEEASRALFAFDRRAFCELMAAWPEDVRDHAIQLAFADQNAA